MKLVKGRKSRPQSGRGRGAGGASRLEVFYRILVRF